MYRKRKRRYSYKYVFRQGKKLDSFWTVLVLDPIAFRLTWLIANYTSITPNKITLLSIFLGIIAAYFFFQGTHMDLIVAGLLLTFSHLLDCVDGKLARLTRSKSMVGAFVDVIKDRIIMLINIIALGFGRYFTSDRLDVIYLGALILIIGSYTRMFSLYYHDIKKGNRIERIELLTTIKRRTKKKAPFLSRLIHSGLQLRDYFHSKRVKVVPHIYDLEMIALLFGSLFNQMKIAFTLLVVVAGTVMITENILRFVMLTRFKGGNGT